MADLVQPRLVNEPFSDPVLYLDFRFRRRALLFDIGYLTPLSARGIVRVTHVFVSHMHMDHFVGFDRLLRTQLYQSSDLRLIGPPGIGDAVEAKLKAYTWNLLGEHSADLVISAADWAPTGYVGQSVFRARAAFAREETEPPQLPPGVLLQEPEFCVEGAMLDHGIPSLAFVLQETIRVDVHKSRLDELGLSVGDWLTEAKRRVRSGEPSDTRVAVGGRLVTLAELLASHAVTTGPGQRIAYATDLSHSPENMARVVSLARGARKLFIEAGYMDQDRALAASKRHLTAAEAGRIARAAHVASAMPMHFSSRYLDREDELRREFEEHFAGCRSDTDVHQ